MGLFQQDRVEDAGRLRSSNIVMLSMGSILGAGLFVGIGDVYQTAGSGIIALFLMIGLAAIVVNLFLIEMNLKGPPDWCFPQYVEASFGPAAGYLVGWAYIGSMVIGPVSEIVAAGMVLRSIFPEIALFPVCLGIGGAVVFLNRFKNSGMEEFHFVTAFLKIFALLCFCLLGLLAMTHLFSGVFYSIPVGWPIRAEPLFSKGAANVLGACVGVIMIFGGAESIGLLALNKGGGTDTGIPAETFNIALRIVFINGFSAFIVVGILGGRGREDISLFIEALRIIGCAPLVLLLFRILIFMSAVSLALTSSLPTSQMLMLQVKSGYMRGIAKLETENRLPFQVSILPDLLILVCLLLVNIWQEDAYTRLFYFSGFCFLVIWLMITITYPRYCKKPAGAGQWKVPCAGLLQPLILGILLMSLFGMFVTRLGRETFLAGVLWFLSAHLMFRHGRRKRGCKESGRQGSSVVKTAGFSDKF